VRFSFLKKQKCKVLILGDVDTGKTYLAFSLIKEALKYHRKIGFLCTDLGQSAVGPPGCVSFKVFTRGDKISSSSSLIIPDIIDFVGSLSPAGVEIFHLASTKIVLEKALKQAEFIVINTTGYIRPIAAQSLKVLKIRLISPEVIIAITKRRELSYILDNFSKSSITLYTLKKSVKVKRKSKRERAEFRLKLFRAYFKKAHSLSFKVRSSYFSSNMVIGLLDREFTTLALGLVKRKFNSRIEIIAPPFRGKVSYLRPSSIIIPESL